MALLGKKTNVWGKDDLYWRFGLAELKATEYTGLTEVLFLHWSQWNHHICSGRRTLPVALTSGCHPMSPVPFCPPGGGRLWQCTQEHFNLPWLPFLQRKEKQCWYPMSFLTPCHSWQGRKAWGTDKSSGSSTLPKRNLTLSQENLVKG